MKNHGSIFFPDSPIMRVAGEDSDGMGQNHLEE
jgi:hypothetical protein